MPKHTPRLRPTSAEHPIIRIRYTNPYGEAHQVTISSTWSENRERIARLNIGQGTKRDHAFRDQLLPCIEKMMNTVGGSVTSFELVNSTTVELL